MQSNDYKPGVSGWRLENDVLYINRASLGSANAVPEPQMIEIEVFNHRQDELPTTPGALTKLITDARGEAYEAGARGDGAVQLEFYTETIDPEYPTPRLRMYFRRLENIDELCARLKRAASKGPALKITAGGLEFSQDGIVRMRVGDCVAEADHRAKADNALATQYAIKLAVNAAGQYVTTGIGAGIEAAKPHAVGDAPDLLEQVSAAISKTALAEGLRESLLAEKIRKVIAEQLRPGGLLHRHHGGR